MITIAILFGVIVGCINGFCYHDSAIALIDYFKREKALRKAEHDHQLYINLNK